MSWERFAQIIIVIMIVLGTNAIAAIFVPGGLLGSDYGCFLIISPVVVGTLTLKKRFTQSLISMGVGTLGAALIFWLPSFFFGSYYFNSWPLVGLGSGYLLAGLAMKARERQWMSVSE